MSQAAIEQDVKEGEVEHSQVIQRTFKTLDALADFIKTFGIVHGGFAPGFVEGLGHVFILEYPFREQE